MPNESKGEYVFVGTKQDIVELVKKRLADKARLRWFLFWLGLALPTVIFLPVMESKSEIAAVARYSMAIVGTGLSIVTGIRWWRARPKPADHW